MLIARVSAMPCLPYDATLKQDALIAIYFRIVTGAIKLTDVANV